MNGKRTSALEKILSAIEPTREYKQQLTKLIREDLHNQEQAAIVAKAEKLFSDYRRDEGTKKLNAIVSKNKGKKPTSEPKRNARVRFPDGWATPEVGFSGEVLKAPPPSYLAEEITNPVKANSRRRVANSEVRNQLRAISGELDREAAELTARRDLADALLYELEQTDAKAPEVIRWRKVPAHKAGVLPAYLSGQAPTYEGRFPPENEREREQARKIWPGYGYWEKLPEVIETPYLNDEQSAYYLPVDELREAHDKFLREAVFNGKVEKFEPDIDAAVELADKRIFAGG